MLLNHVFSVCGLLSSGLRSAVYKYLEMRTFQKLSQTELIETEKCYICEQT